MTYRAFTIDQIIRGFKTIPITSGQLDFNGLCNAKCWYCPVKYEGNPKEFKANTSLADVSIILSRIKQSKYVKQGLDFVYTCHYNEILLHPEFEEILKLFRNYKMRTMILSNGTPLTPSNLDIILNYPDVISGICLNIPDIDVEKWAAKAGFSTSVHKSLTRNLKYINANYPAATIQVNTSQHGVEVNQFVGSNVENARILKEFKELYPNLTVNFLTGLSDRAGRLTEHKVLIDKKINKGRVISGCSHSDPVGGRIYSWFHINSKGDMFICCDDYQMEYKFGNLLENDFDTIWESVDHADAVLKARGELCKNCSFAV